MATWSKYNLAVPRENGGGYLFNTRTGALLGMSAPRFSQIGSAQLLDDDLYSVLAREGFIIDDDVDELALIRDANERARSSSDSFSATIELTESCNFSCKYCYQAHTPNHLDERVAARIVRYLAGKMASVPHVHVNWFGGEPLLRWRMLEAMSGQLTREAAQRGCKVTQFLTTNGYLLTREKAQSLAAMGIQNIQITLDGDMVAHDRLRPLASGRGTYRQVLAACVAVVEAGIELLVRVNLNRCNADRVVALLDDLLDHGITPDKAVIHIVRAVNHGGCNTDMAQACYTTAEFAGTWITLLEEVARRGFGLPSLAPAAYNCPFDLPHTVMIGCDGTLRYCSSADGRLGEISDTGEAIMPTALSARIKNRRPTDAPACLDCRYLPMCMGGCSYLRDIGQEACNPERYVLGEMVALVARQGLH